MHKQLEGQLFCGAWMAYLLVAPPRNSVQQAVSCLLPSQALGKCKC